MPPNTIRIIIDTNWWGSFVIKRYRNQLVLVLLDDRLEIFCSEALVSEVTDTLKEPAMAKYLDSGVLEDFLTVFPEGLKEVRVVSSVAVCRDPKDNFLLALSKDAQAHYLVTGDKDLLVLKEFEGTVICTLPEFLERIR